MRRRHTEGVQVIGSWSKSDSKDGCFRSQKTGRRVFVTHEPNGRGYRAKLSGESRKVCHADPLNIGCRGCRCNRRSLVCPNFSPAATHLLHVAAPSVHCTAASTFVVAHHY